MCILPNTCMNSYWSMFQELLVSEGWQWCIGVLVVNVAIGQSRDSLLFQSSIFTLVFLLIAELPLSWFEHAECMCVKLAQGREPFRFSGGYISSEE